MTNSSNTHSRPSTPTVSVPHYEKSIYDSLSQQHSTLLALKNNRSKYINSKQVYQIYDQFLNLLHELKLTRKDEELKGLTLNLPNANDLLIDDVWQLLSLCFVTCGLIKFAPATYSSLSTVGKLLDHLRGCQVYTLEDLKPIKQRLDEVKQIIDNNNLDEDYDDDEESAALQEKNVHKMEENLLLRTKLNKCEALYQELEDNFKNIPKDLEKTYSALIAMRKKILGHLTNYSENNDSSVPSSVRRQAVVIQVNKLKSELKEIESRRDASDGKFHSKEIDADQDEGKLNSIQVVFNGLIDDCNNLLNDLLIHTDSSSLASLLESSLDLKDDEGTRLLKSTNKKFETLYNQLLELKVTLENLLVTRRWTLRETDLYSYQKILKSIDDERVALTEEISKVPPPEETSTSVALINQHLRKNQMLILYLLRRCYALIYKLLESSEAVSESLQPIHNQLSTVRRCLLEIKRVDGLNNLRELYPFQFKLASLDNLRTDGKFIINNTIPEGQGTLNALLAECFDIIYELKIELEEKEEAREADGEEDNVTDEEDIKSDDEVELKRNRYMGFNEADYDQESESAFDDDDDDYSLSESEYEGNDYY
ncbi:uncharacterized protein RJT20DRAFT_143942 [Scheffersomyces xylosifermentans]|uniref:uncharacterized protein n=1 Tax=Scheffersomyces xylosifermentans TaxID=1304137 RepID=UPI00315C5CC7